MDKKKDDEGLWGGLVEGYERSSGELITVVSWGELIIIILLLLIGAAGTFFGFFPDVPHWVFILIFVIAVFWVVIMPIRLAVQRKDEKFITAYVEKQVPWPEFPSDMDDEKREDEKRKIYLARLQTALDYYEKQSGTPLKRKDQIKIEGLLGYRKKDFYPNLLDILLFSQAEEMADDESDSSLEAELKAEEARLTREFGLKRVRDRVESKYGRDKAGDRLKDLEELVKSQAKARQAINDDSNLSSAEKKEALRKAEQTFIKQLDEF